MAIELLFNNFTDVYHDNKKGGTIRNLFNPEEPPSTLCTNKHEQSTPNEDVNLHLLILVHFKLAVFRIENKSKSSKIFTNKYEWKRYSKCLYFYIFISIQDTSPHIQSKTLRKDAPCIIVRKVKLLFEATQFNKKKKMFHSFTCVIPPNSQCIRKCITRQDYQREHVLYRKQKVKTVSF